MFGAGSQLSRRVHTYDAQGRRIRTQTIFGSLGGDLKRMAYNELGNQIEEIWHHDSKEFSIDDEGHLSEQAEPSAFRKKEFQL